jgi:hypothetical protein
MDVAAWLRGLGLGEYEAAFRDNAVDASVLPELTAEDLREIGVAAVGHRRRRAARRRPGAPSRRPGGAVAGPPRSAPAGPAGRLAGLSVAPFC